VERDARLRIRRALAEAGRRIEVLDDDPAGSQTVHGVDVVTVFEPDELAAGLSEAGSTCCILTNTRSLPEADAVELNIRVGRMLFELADRLQAPEVMVGRRSAAGWFLGGGAGSWSRSFGSMCGPTRPPSPWRCSGRDGQAHGPG
jgi:Sugar-binding N-terminal domain